VRKEFPDPTEIISHILGEDEHAEDEEAADDRIPEASQETPSIVCCEVAERDCRNVVKVLVDSNPTRPGGNRARRQGKENRQEYHQQWPKTHNDTCKEEANEARCGED
jgi:hypothetical protein